MQGLFFFDFSFTPSFESRKNVFRLSFLNKFDGKSEDITGGTVEVDTWQHVAYRYRNGVQSILVNGEVVQSAAKGGLAVESEIVIGSTRGTRTAILVVISMTSGSIRWLYPTV